MVISVMDAMAARDAVSINDWPHITLFGIHRSRVDETADMLLARWVGAEAHQVRETHLKRCGQRADVTLRVRRVPGSTLPVLALDTSREDYDALSDVLQDHLKQRSILHPGIRHILLLTHVERAAPRVQTLLRRLSDAQVHNALFVIIASDLSKLHRSIRDRFTLLNASRGEDRGPPPPPRLEVVDALLRADRPPLTLAALERHCRSLGLADPGAVLRAVAVAGFPEAAAQADLHLIGTGNWALAARQLVMALHEVK